MVTNSIKTLKMVNIKKKKKATHIFGMWERPIGPTMGFSHLVSVLECFFSSLRLSFPIFKMGLAPKDCLKIQSR